MSRSSKLRNFIISGFKLAKKRLWIEGNRDLYLTIVSSMRDSSISMVFLRIRGECNPGTLGAGSQDLTPLQIEDAFQGLKCPSSILGQLASRMQSGAITGGLPRPGAKSRWPPYQMTKTALRPEACF
jgi:hypothetical protein